MSNNDEKTNLEDMFIDPNEYVVRRDLDQFNPSKFYSKNEVLERAVELYRGQIGADVRLELGAALYYLSSLFNYKRFEEINIEEEEEKAFDRVFIAEAELAFSALNCIISMHSDENKKKIEETCQKLINKFGKIKYIL